MKKNTILFICVLFANVVFSQSYERSTIYNDSVLMKKVVEELTWSVSNRGYYIPILTCCDNMSDIKLTLSSMGDLLRNYSNRNRISINDFRELIATTIKNSNILDGICTDDFKFLYGRDNVTARAIVFMCDSQCPNELNEILSSSDFYTFFSWAFDSKGRYQQSFQLLPHVAHHLMQYGIVLICGMGTDDIYYDDLLN